MNEPFCFLRNFLTVELCREVEAHCLQSLQSENRSQTNRADIYPAEKSHAPGMQRVFGDPFTEQLLERFRPRVEQSLRLEMLPTYSSYRLYQRGDSVAPHTDRAACQYLLSVCVGRSEPEKSWPFFVGASKQYRLDLKLGDAVIFSGRKFPHWRLPLEQDWALQALFFYVDKSMPYAETLRFDGRAKLGLKHTEESRRNIQQGERLVYSYEQRL